MTLLLKAAAVVAVLVITACANEAQRTPSGTIVSDGGAPLTAPPASNVHRWTVGTRLLLGSAPGQLDLELYIEQGCSQCDGPPVTLERVRRSPQGEMTREILFRTPKGARYLTSTAVGGDGTLYATACFGSCWEVGGFVDEDAGYSVIYSSVDGGTNWNESQPENSARKFDGATLPSGEVILLDRQASRSEPMPQPTYRLYPSGTELVPPAPNTFPEATANPAEPILWIENERGRILRPDGQEVPVPKIEVGSGSGNPTAFGTLPRVGVSLMWLDTRDGRRDWHFTFVEAGVASLDYLGDDQTGAPWVEIWLDDHRALGRWNYSEAALFDFANATIRPIQIYDPIPDDPLTARNRIVGYRTPRP